MRLQCAVQKKGRLNEKSMSLIRDCGISITGLKSQLKNPAKNFPMDLLFLRDDDIPGYVADGVADIGIVGENEVVEHRENVRIIKKLGFADCRLSIAIPRDKEYDSAQSLNNKIIATSYPNILGQYLKEKNINAKIHTISGSVEIAPTIGLTDAICDLVSTGSTLLSNGLKEVESIFSSTAVLIAAPELSPEKATLLDTLVSRIEAVQHAQNYKYILLNAPNKAIASITKLLPGINSPSVVPLAREGWSSIHSVIPEDDFWENIERLKAVGAEGILVTPIEKIIY